MRSQQLTNREIEVLHLIAEGATNKEIGQKLYISEHTAKAHCVNIMGKLIAFNRTQTVTNAFRLGIIK